MIGKPLNPGTSGSSSSSIGIAGSQKKNGIVPVKLRNHFRVRFIDSAQLTYSDLSIMVKSVSEIVQDMVYNNGSVVICVEDDEWNYACDSIQSLISQQKQGNRFKIEIEFLDKAENVLRTHRLSGCEITAVTHGGLTYDTYSNAEKEVYVDFVNFEIV